MIASLNIYYGKQDLTAANLVAFTDWLVLVLVELYKVPVPDLKTAMNASWDDDTGKLMGNITITYPKTTPFTEADYTQMRNFIKTNIYDTMPDGSYVKKTFEWKP